MEFDKNKVYTSVNADEVKIGSVGIFADSLADLRVVLSILEKSQIKELYTLKCLRDDSYSCRFFNGKDYYPIFYLLKESEVEEYRPYNNIKEFLDDYCDMHGSYWSEIRYPQIWLNIGEKQHLKVVGLDFKINKILLSNGVWCDLEWMFQHYTYLDSKKCGIKEK